jgi:hypothetical protein
MKKIQLFIVLILIVSNISAQEDMLAFVKDTTYYSNNFIFINDSIKFIKYYYEVEDFNIKTSQAIDTLDIAFPQYYPICDRKDYFDTIDCIEYSEILNYFQEPIISRCNDSIVIRYTVMSQGKDTWDTINQVMRLNIFGDSIYITKKSAEVVTLDSCSEINRIEKKALISNFAKPLKEINFNNLLSLPVLFNNMYDCVGTSHLIEIKINGHYYYFLRWGRDVYVQPKKYILKDYKYNPKEKSLLKLFYLLQELTKE